MTLTIKNIPICECHKEEMGWHKDKRSKNGGSWYCRVHQKELAQKNRDKNREKNREQGRAKYWKEPEKYRQRSINHRKKNIDKYKEYEKKRYLWLKENEYEKLRDKGRKAGNKYSNSLHGYITRRKWCLNKMREENTERLNELQEENPWLTN